MQDYSRSSWVQKLISLCDPIYRAGAERRLCATMPVEHCSGEPGTRAATSQLEAVGRSLAGVAPWLNLPDEVLDAGERGEAEAQRQNVLATLSSIVDPESPDYLFEPTHHQKLVDTAFLAQALLRGWDRLWLGLDEAARENLIRAFEGIRVFRPPFNNWLLFSATVEVFLEKAGAGGNQAVIDYALRQHEQWYKGDGAYGDGPNFHFDYYNSYVIQPMLLDVSREMAGQMNDWDLQRPMILRRATRYAEVQERLIAPDGSFPVIGRSICYRCGAFQVLAQAALEGLLPETVTPAQARCALSAVIARTLDAPGTVDEAGWLKIGLCGSQPSLSEDYISTGSLYLALLAFLPLGLAPDHVFWVEPETDWSSRKIWSGADHPADHAIRGDERCWYVN